jgi:hypothetical protein
MPAKRLNLNHIKKYCEVCNSPLKLKNNRDVVRKEIHKLYHKLYGHNKGITEEKWNNFVNNKEYTNARQE